MKEEKGREFPGLWIMADELKKLYIEPTSRCNLSCTMCFRNTWVDEELADMELDVFERAVSTMPESVETVFFGGMGEPLAHEKIVDMVRSAASAGRRVELLTNGTLLTREVSAALLDAGLSMLWASVDAFEAGEYEAIRQNGSFSLVRENISAFNAERLKRDDAAALGLAFVVTRANVGQLGALARFASENRASKVNISNAIPTDYESWRQTLYSRIVGLELYTEKGEGVCPEVSLPLMDVRIPGVWEGLLELLAADMNVHFNGVPLLRRRRTCRFIEEGCAFVRHDGDVCPCMALLHSATTYLEGSRRTVFRHSFGNVRNMGLGEIWNSGEYSAFRARVRNFDFSPCIQCGGCDNREDNVVDCLGNKKPTCGACLWSEGIISCP